MKCLHQVQDLPPGKFGVINNLEASLASDRPRALIRMATGSGKIFTAVGFIYRIPKFGNAKRVLFPIGEEPVQLTWMELS